MGGRTRIAKRAIRGLSNPRELRKSVKIPIAGVKNQIVLENQSRDPHIVYRHRRSLFPKLTIEGRVVMCRLVVSEDYLHSVFPQEVSKRALVLWLPGSVSESGAKLREDHKGQNDEFRFCE